MPADADQGAHSCGYVCFAEEFPDFRDLHRVVDPSQLKTCGHVFDGFLRHCASRVARDDLSATTLDWYTRGLNGTWRSHLERVPFLTVPFHTLTAIADSNKNWNKKTYNNSSICVLRRAFAFGYLIIRTRWIRPSVCGTRARAATAGPLSNRGRRIVDCGDSS